MHINWPGGLGRATEFAFEGGRGPTNELRKEQDRQVDKMKKILLDARAYADAKDARAKDASLPKQDVDLKMEALIPVVRGQMPVIISANAERDIREAIAFADEMKISIETVRSHARKIYEKLQVQSRTEALNKVYGRQS